MEKSLEELMSNLSEGVITTTNDEPMVIDMSDSPIQEPVQIVSQSPITETEVKPEVQEMIEENENNFYAQNIEKDMDVLEKEFVAMERSAAVIDAKIHKIKIDNSEIFDEIEALEKEKEALLEHESDYKEVITSKMASIGTKNWK